MLLLADKFPPTPRPEDAPLLHGKRAYGLFYGYAVDVFINQPEGDSNRVTICQNYEDFRWINQNQGLLIHGPSGRNYSLQGTLLQIIANRARNLGINQKTISSENHVTLN